MPLSEQGRAERASWLQLVLTPGLGPVAIHRLLQEFGLPEDVLRADAGALAKVLPPALATALAEGAQSETPALQANLDWAEREANHLVALGDEAYPRALLALHDPPPLLWVIGRVELLNRRAIAVVGSRQASRAGCARAHALAQALGDAGWTVVSGLAQGIDAAAHRGALAGRAGTLAIVGNGLDRVYPAANHDLAHRIARDGALVSEFALGTPPLPHQFPRRNRLIAAISAGTLVVEAARDSGSLITARLAAEAGREVFAVPGSIDSPLSKGCHLLLREGARLVESVEDLLEELEPAGARILSRRHDAPSAPHPLLADLGWDPVGVDLLSERTGADVAQLSAQLLLLELDGRIERLADGRYQQLRPERARSH